MEVPNRNPDPLPDAASQDGLQQDDLPQDVIPPIHRWRNPEPSEGERVTRGEEKTSGGCKY